MSEDMCQYRRTYDAQHHRARDGEPVKRDNRNQSQSNKNYGNRCYVS